MNYNIVQMNDADRQRITDVIKLDLIEWLGYMFSIMTSILCILLIFLFICMCCIVSILDTEQTPSALLMFGCGGILLMVVIYKFVLCIIRSNLSKLALKISKRIENDNCYVLFKTDKK